MPCNRVLFHLTDKVLVVCAKLRFCLGYSEFLTVKYNVVLLEEYGNVLTAS